jgi:Fic family protein
MHIEARRLGRRTKFYLAHSYRQVGKVRKSRIYLGVGLSPARLARLRRQAAARLGEKIRAERRLSDPLHTVLSRGELEEIENLRTKARVKVANLSDDDWRKFTDAFAYDTNAIEGSTIDSREVADILEKGRWPDKPKGEISETYGVAKAIDFIRITREHVSLPLILKLHRLVFENSKPFAGKLRAKGVEVVVTDGRWGVVHRGAQSAHVRELLVELAGWYEKNRNRYPPLVLAAIVHNQLENIHPFEDGNGRVGRLLLNNVLLRHGWPPVNIELENRGEYYAALQAYENRHDLRPTIELMLKEYRALGRLLKKRR